MIRMDFERGRKHDRRWRDLVDERDEAIDEPGLLRERPVRE